MTIGSVLSALHVLRAEFMCFSVVVMSFFHQGFALGGSFLVGIKVFASVVMSRRYRPALSRLASVGRCWRSCHTSDWFANVVRSLRCHVGQSALAQF